MEFRRDPVFGPVVETGISVYTEICLIVLGCSFRKGGTVHDQGIKGISAAAGGMEKRSS